MSTLKSDNENLILNADGADRDIIFQSNSTEKARLDKDGLFTATTIDATKLTGALPAVDGSNLTGITASGTLLDDIVFGKVLQVVDLVNAQYGTISGSITNDDSIPQSTEGGELVSGSITPVSSTSTFYCSLQGNSYRAANSLNGAVISMFTDGSTFWNIVNNSFDAFVSTRVYSTGAQTESFSLEGNVASSGVSAVTFSARLAERNNQISHLNGSTAGRMYGGALKITLRVMEVAT
jgi:hypothetical protein